MKDFFSRYHASKTYQYLFSGVLAFVLSIGITGVLRDVPLTALSANVLMAPESVTPTYAADLLIERSGSSITVRMGKNAEQVENVSLSLLSDPTLFTELTSLLPNTKIISNEPGAFLVSLSFNKEDIMAGQVLTTLTTNLPAAAFLAPVDATFLSAGQSYSLSLETK